MTCIECGGTTAWDDDAGSAICTHCGTLSDPSQTLLLASHENPNAVSHSTRLWDGGTGTTLKSFRSRTGNWDLAGQGKEARDRKNTTAMAHFISSLAVSINASGLSPRATIIFNQAMAAGKYHWGRKAKLVAGASLAIALREYRRPDSLNDIAYLLDEKCPTLVRTLTGVVALLEISLTPVDPSIHIPPLMDNLTSFLNKDPLQPQSQPTAQLPASLVSQLKLISLRAASNTAVGLSHLLARLGPDHSLNSLPSPPTAVALFLLGLEAESRTPLSQLGELAHLLGARCHKTSRSVAMQRYKLIQDEVASWIEQVPWLGKYEQRNLGKGKNRAKIGKRSIVARGVADVLQFQDEIWRGKLRPTVVLDTTDQDQEDYDDDDEGTEMNMSTLSTTANVASSSRRPLPDSFTRPAPVDLASRPPPPKRQKVVHQPLRDATQFLLNPLSAPLPPCESPPRRAPLLMQPRAQAQVLVHAQVQDVPVSPPDFQNNAYNTSAYMRSSMIPQPLRMPSPLALTYPNQTPTPTLTPTPSPAPALAPTHFTTISSSSSRASLTSYILTAPHITDLRGTAPPTRLQLLAASRAGADDIGDDELFGVGELEGFLRAPEEAEELRDRLVKMGISLSDEEEDGERDEKRAKERARRQAKARGKEKEKGVVRMGRVGGAGADEPPRKSRVNLEALARFLKGDGEGDEGGEEDKDSEGYDAVLLGLERLSDKEDEGDDDHDFQPAVRRFGDYGRAKPKVPRKHTQADNAGVVVAEWRPLSPEMGFRHLGGGAVYEEEYD